MKDIPDWYHRPYFADVTLIMLHAAQGRLAFLNEELVAYRRHSGSVHAGGAQARSEEREMVQFRGMIDFYEMLDRHFDGRFHDVLRLRVAEHCYDLAWPLVRRGERAELRRTLGKAARNKLFHPKVRPSFVLKCWIRAWLPRAQGS